MTTDETLRLGNYCESLMRDPNFNTLTTLFKEQAFKAAMGTNPEDAQKRESVYADVWGLQNFLGLMSGFVQERDAFKAIDDLEASQDDAQD